MAVTSDGRFAVSASVDDTLMVWDLQSGHAIHSLQGHTDWVNDVAVTSDGRFAVSASRDKTLILWDHQSGHAVRSLQGHTHSVNGVAVTSDGRFVVSTSDDKTLRIWELESGRAVTTLETHAEMLCCAITADGKIIVAGDEAGALHTLDWRNPPIAPPTSTAH